MLVCLCIQYIFFLFFFVFFLMILLCSCVLRTALSSRGHNIQSGVRFDRPFDFFEKLPATYELQQAIVRCIYVSIKSVVCPACRRFVFYFFSIVCFLLVFLMFVALLIQFCFFLPPLLCLFACLLQLGMPSDKWLFVFFLNLFVCFAVFRASSLRVLAPIKLICVCVCVCVKVCRREFSYTAMQPRLYV